MVQVQTIASTSELEAGYLQTLEYLDDKIVIHDRIYGDHTITEPVLIDLLKSPSVLRLSRVGQHGITSFVGLTPNVTRFEHSVGAFLVVRQVGGTVTEQVVGLLHDISHTAFSHVIDCKCLFSLTCPFPGPSYRCKAGIQHARRID